MVGSSQTPPATAEADDAPLVRSGVDVVAISRVEALLSEFGDSVRERAFTAAERAYCESRPDPAQHYAARWGATEAFRKVLVHDAATPPLAAVGVVRAGDEVGDGGGDSQERSEGTPTLALGTAAREALAETCRSAGVPPSRARTSVSLSHDRTAAVAAAQVVLVGVPDAPGSGDGRDGGGPP